MDKVINLGDYDFSIDVEEIERDPWDELTFEDIANCPTSVYPSSSSDSLNGILGVHDIVNDLLRVNPDKFLTSLMFTYVNMKTNESIKEKAQKFKIHENLLFSAYYRIFLKTLKRGNYKNIDEAYNEVYRRTGIGDRVIKSISAAKSNHKKHAKKIITIIKTKLGILK